MTTTVRLMRQHVVNKSVVWSSDMEVYSLGCLIFRSKTGPNNSFMTNFLHFNTADPKLEKAIVPPLVRFLCSAFSPTLWKPRCVVVTRAHVPSV